MGNTMYMYSIRIVLCGHTQLGHAHVYYASACLHMMYVGLHMHNLRTVSMVYHGGLPTYYCSAGMAAIAPLWAMLPDFIEYISPLEKRVVIFSKYSEKLAMDHQRQYFVKVT